MSKELIFELRKVARQQDYHDQKELIEEAIEHIEQLRAQLKEAQKELENERARSIHTCGPNCQRPTCVNRRLTGQLAASQANEVQLRDGLVLAKVQSSKSDRDQIIDQALSLPSDTTALDAMIQKAGEVMRERAVDEAKSLSDCEDNATKYRAGASFCCEKIRALPGVTVGDLKGGA